MSKNQQGASKQTSKAPPKLDKTKVQKFVEQFFMRPVKFPMDKCKIAKDEGGLKTAKDQTIDTMMSFFAGTFNIDEATWRVLGMSQRRYDVTNVCQYDVIQLPKKWKVGGVEVEEQMPFSKREHLMRVYMGDSEEEMQQLRLEKEMLRLMRKATSHNKRFYDCFPRLLAEGTLGSLKFAEPYAFSFIHTPQVPKPFFIMEKVGPSLEAFFRSGRQDRMSPYCTVFVIIGCVQALRHLHDLGFVYRDVQPANFAMRMGPTGKLNRREADVTSRLVLTHFGLTRPYRKKAVRRGVACIGTKKYCSSSAMRFEEVTPPDDLISCMYMMHEFLTGSLPWSAGSGIYKHVLQEKEKLEKLKDVVDTAQTDVKKKDTLFDNVIEVYKEIKKANGFDQSVNYREIMAKLAAGVEKKTDKDRNQSIFSFQQPTMFTYRHGIVHKDGTKAMPDGCKTIETDEIRAKADYIFPTTRDNERKKELKSKKSVKK